MATIDGRPAQYGVSLKTLRELMEHRGREGIARINEVGGVQELCKKLYTSPNEGKSNSIGVCIHRIYWPCSIAIKIKDNVNRLKLNYSFFIWKRVRMSNISIDSNDDIPKHVLIIKKFLFDSISSIFI